MGQIRQAGFNLEKLAGFRAGETTVRRKLEGPVLTCAFIVLHLIASTVWPSLREVSSFLLLAAGYATFRGGLRSGIVSGIIAYAYFTYAFSEKRLFEYDHSDLERLISILIGTAGIIALVHALKLRLLQSELEKTLLFERAEKEAAQAASRSLERVSSAIAHDLRNPVRYVVGHSEILLERVGERIGPEEEASLRKIRGYSEEIDRLILELIDYINRHPDDRGGR